MSCGPREENWTVPHVADFQGHWQKVRRKRDNSGLASVQCGKGQLAGGVWVIVAFVTVVVVTVFVFIVVFVIVVTVALAMELMSTALIAIPTEVYSLHYLALSTRCLSKNAELHARQLALIRPVLPDALLVNALGWPLRRPKRWRLRLRVRLSESSGAYRLYCSTMSLSASILQLQTCHAPVLSAALSTVLSFSQTSCVQQELFLFLLSCSTLCMPTCLKFFSFL